MNKELVIYILLGAAAVGVVWWLCRRNSPVIVPIQTAAPPGHIGVSPASPTNSPTQGAALAGPAAAPHA